MAAPQKAERGSAVLELPRGPRLVCVEYPGLVRDVEKMLRTLGGEDGVSRVSGAGPAGCLGDAWDCSMKPPAWGGGAVLVSPGKRAGLPGGGITRERVGLPGGSVCVALGRGGASWGVLVSSGRGRG